MIAQRVEVYKGGSQVFVASAGRFGQADSANRDFIGFASPIVGAAGHYLACEEWAARIAREGFETVFVTSSGAQQGGGASNKKEVV